MLMRISSAAILLIALFQSVCHSGQSQKAAPRNEFVASNSPRENPSPAQKTETRRIQLFPKDEAAKDHSFLVFRTRLLAAVKRHDRDFVLKTLDREIMNGDDIEKGVNEFKKRWQLDQQASPLWDLLSSILSNGGAFNRDDGHEEFCAPYAVTAWSEISNQLPAGADPIDYVAITGKHVSVRETPNANSPVIYILSYDVVKVDAKGSVRAGSPPHGFTWLKITTPSGQRGYVKDEDAQGPMDYRACFRKVGRQWLMTELAARE